MRFALILRIYKKRKKKKRAERINNWNSIQNKVTLLVNYFRRLATIMTDCAEPEDSDVFFFFISLTLNKFNSSMIYGRICLPLQTCSYKLWWKADKGFYFVAVTWGSQCIQRTMIHFFGWSSKISCTSLSSNLSLKRKKEGVPRTEMISVEWS